MLDRISSIVLGFDGLGGIERFADYSQWEAWQESQEGEKERTRLPEATVELRTAAETTPPITTKKKLSYRESRELESMEQRIAEAEQELRDRQAALQDSAIVNDGPRLHSASLQLDEARKAVDKLYARWTELEHKKG